MLQPNDAEGLLVRAFGASARGGARFIAVAGRLGLRWIIPADLGSASRALADWRPYKLSSRLGWSVVQLASRAGVLSAFPGARPLSVDLTNVAWHEFGWTRPHPPLVIAYVGTVGLHQKLVCNFVDAASGQTELVVKFPLAETAKECLRREFDTLGQLIAEGRDVGPKPLLIDNHTRFAAQSFLQGRPDGMIIEGPHLAFLASLIQPGRALQLEAVRGALLARRNELAASGALQGANLQRADEVLNATGWDGSVPSVRSHGDFAPWNLKRDRDGSVRAVDWEDSVENALPYIDLHHFRHSLRKTLSRGCAVPWDAYTAALGRTDPSFSGARAETAYRAAALSYWLSNNFKSDWERDVR